ncbi:hypothetical protein L211DRAFT_841197, partial [Terfezia boudieri ATCC MYA-4762]
MEAIHERQRGVWVLRIISIGASKAISNLPLVIENAVEGKAAEGGRSRVQKFSHIRGCCPRGCFDM